MGISARTPDERGRRISVFLREKAAAEIIWELCIHERADRVYKHLPERLLLLRDTKEQSECGALPPYDRTDLILRKERV